MENRTHCVFVLSAIIILFLTGNFETFSFNEADAITNEEINTCFERYNIWESIGTSEFYNMFNQNVIMKICVSFYENGIIESNEYEKKFTDLTDQSIVQNIPEKFTLDWYLNEEYGYALKFPGPVEENWEIKINPVEPYRVFFPSKNTDGLLEVAYTFIIDTQGVGEFDEEQLFKLFEENALDIEGLVIRSLDVTRGSDGVIYDSYIYFPIIEGTDVYMDLRNYKIISFVDGRMYRLWYSGDDFTALTTDDLDSMTESFFAGDVHSIRVSSISPPLPILEQSKSFEWYTNPTENLRMEYPSSWLKIEPESSETIAMFTSPPENFDDDYMENFFIVKEKQLLKIGLDDYLKLFIQQLGAIPAFEIIDSVETTLEEYPARKIVYTGYVEGVGIKGLSVVSIKDDTVYIIGFNGMTEKFSNYLPIVERMIASFDFSAEIPTTDVSIPEWIRNNAEWWAQGAIGDSDFVSGIQYLIKEGILKIPETVQPTNGEVSEEIPSWIKNNADWWAQGLITDDDFVKGIQYLVENGIIRV